ncbi:winged helix-turn-helix domain-containing protein [Deinococcus depolymerans]|uniref:OmpR/PhoB-type domain-containing protein n=1 Tax=Deinococcus depolymerans TaxID=392408 RepID=A0ABP3LBQ7_9DEIO
MNHPYRQGASAADPFPEPGPAGPAADHRTESPSLTARELALFDLLSGQPGRLYSRSEILERIWGLAFGGDERVVDAYVNRVRRKVPGSRIETVRGAGYRCAPPDTLPGMAPPHPDAGADAWAALTRQVETLQRQALQARQDSEALLHLTHALEDARSVPAILGASLPLLAELARADACAAWYPSPAAPPAACLHRTGLPVPCPAGGPADAALRVEAAGQVLTLRPFTLLPRATDVPAGTGRETETPREASTLLVVAARCVALALAQSVLVSALERSALTDESTGLGNRQAFLGDLSTEVAYAARHGTAFAVALVDLGNIRYLNATAGYAGGNDLISRLARTLGGATRREDRAYRLNGATFALLLRLPPAGQPAALRGWQERSGLALAELRRSAPVPLDLYTSLVVCPDDAQDSSDLLRLALDRLSAAPPARPPFPPAATHRPADG